MDQFIHGSSSDVPRYNYKDRPNLSYVFDVDYWTLESEYFKGIDSYKNVWNYPISPEIKS